MKVCRQDINSIITSMYLGEEGNFMRIKDAIRNFKNRQNAHEVSGEKELSAAVNVARRSIGDQTTVITMTGEMKEDAPSARRHKRPA